MQGRYDQIAFQLINNANRLFAANKTWHIIQHLTVLLNTADSGILEQNTVSALLIFFIQSIEKLVQKKSINRFKAIRLINGALNVGRNIQNSLKKEDKQRLKELLANLQGGLFEESTVQSEEANSKLTESEEKYTLRKQRVFLLLDVLQERLKNPQQDMLPERLSTKFFDQIKIFIDQQMRGQNFKSTSTLLQQFLTLATKYDKLDLVHYCNQQQSFIQQAQGPQNARPLPPFPNQIVPQRNIAKRGAVEVNSSPLDNEQIELLLKLVSDNDIDHTRFFSAVTEFYDECMQVSDIGSAFRILEQSIAFCDKLSLSQIKHQFALAMGDLMLQTTEKDEDSPIKPLPAFNLILQSLLNYFEGLPQLLANRSQQKINETYQKITTLEAKFLYQTTQPWLFKNIARALAQNDFEATFHNMERLGKQLVACFEYDLAWTFYAGIKEVLTSKDKGWHGKLFEELALISNNQMSSQRQPFSFKGQWQEYLEAINTHRHEFTSTANLDNFALKQKVFTTAMIEIIYTWLSGNENLLGPRRFKLCIAGQGSMARKTMSLGSDGEFVVIVENPQLEDSLIAQSEEKELTEDAKWLDVFYRLFEFKFNSIGELRGFRLDKEGHPRVELRLIGTPEQLFAKNTPPAAKLADDMTYSLLNCCYVYGDKELLIKFQTLLTQRLKQPILADDNTPWQKLILQNYLPLHIKHLTEEYNIDDLFKGNQGQGFDIKKYLIGFLMYFVADKCLHHGISFVSPESALKLFKSQNHMDFLWADAYQFSTHLADLIRIRLHDYCKEQKDTVYYAQDTKPTPLKLTTAEEGFIKLIIQAIIKPSIMALKALQQGQDKYLYNPARIIIQEALQNYAINPGLAPLPETVLDAMRSLIASIILARGDEDHFHQIYLEFPKLFREAFKQQTQLFKNYFNSALWNKIQEVFLDTPYPDGTRDSYIVKVGAWKKMLAALVTREQVAPSKKDKVVAFRWESPETGEVGTYPLHPEFLECLKQKGFLDKKLELIRNKTEAHTLMGTHMVLPIDTTLNGQRIKIHAKLFPELPGTEDVTSYLAHRIEGWGLPLVQIAKLIIGKESYPVLLSQTINGKLLEESFRPENIKTIEQRLHSRYFSKKVLLSVNLNHEDGKPSNIIGEPIEDDQIALVMIDPDRSHYPDVAEEEGKIVPIIKDITYCFDKMREPIHPRERRDFLSLNAFQLLTRFGDYCAKRAEIIKQIFTEEELLHWFPKSKSSVLKNIMGKDDLVKETILGVILPVKTMANLYVNINRGQDLFRHNPEATGFDLLRYTHPYLSIYYGNLHHDFPTIDLRFNNGFELLYDKREKKSGAHQTKKTAVASLQTMHGKPISVDEFKRALTYSVDEARQELLDIHQVQTGWRNILAKLLEGDHEGIMFFSTLKDITIIQNIINTIDFKKLKNEQFAAKLIQIIIAMDVSFNVLKLTNCTIDDERIELLLKKAQNLQVLRLENCPNVTGNVISIIARYCPILESLTIVNSNLKLVDNRNAVLIPLFTPLSSKTPVSFGELRYLDLSFNPGLTELHLNAKHLAKIHLRNCSQLKIVKFNSKAIEQLNISGCSLLTNDRLSDCVTDATKLTEIITDNCPLIRCSDFYAKFPYLLPVDVSVYTKVFLRRFVAVLEQIMPTKLTKEIATQVLTIVQDFKNGGDILKKVLLKQLQKESTDVIQASTLAFTKLGRSDKDIIDELMKLRNHQRPGIQQAAAISLYELGSRDEKNSKLVESGLNSYDDKIVFATLTALVSAEEANYDNNKILLILNKLLNDNNPVTMNQALLVSSYLRDVPETFIHSLQQMMRNSSSEVVAMAIYALAAIAYQQNQIQLFRTTFRNSGIKDKVILNRALILARQNNIAVYKFLEIEFMPYFAVMEAPDQNLVAELKNNDNWNVQVNALNRLNKEKHYQIDLITIASELFSHLRSNIRELAINYVISVNYSDEKVQEKYLAVLTKESDWRVRSQAVKGLAIPIASKNTQVTNVLGKCLLGSNENTQVRMFAAESLSFQADFTQETIKTLAQGAEDKYTDVITASIKSLTILISFNTLNINLTQLDFAEVKAYVKPQQVQKVWAYSTNNSPSTRTLNLEDNPVPASYGSLPASSSFLGNRLRRNNTDNSDITQAPDRVLPVPPPQRILPAPPQRNNTMSPTLSFQQRQGPLPASPVQPRVAPTLPFQQRNSAPDVINSASTLHKK